MPAAGASRVDPGDRLGFAIADLTTDDGWTEVMAGDEHVLHVAASLGLAPRDRNALVAAARDGALRVLRKAVVTAEARVILTSAAATARDRQTGRSSEDIWATLENPCRNPIAASKSWPRAPHGISCATMAARPP